MRIVRLVAFVALVGGLSTADLSAQALASLSSVRVGYNTRKATVKPEGELKVQLDELEKQIAEANRLGRTGEVRRLYAKGMVLLAGRPWTDAEEYNAALVIRTDRLMVDSSAPYRVRLEQIFAPAIELTRSLTAHATLRSRSGAAASGTSTAAPSSTPAPIELGTFEGVTRDLRESPFPIDLNVANVPDGSYTLSIEVRDAERTLGTATLSVSMLKGLDGRLRALETAATKAQPAVQTDLRFPGDYVRKINQGVIGVGTFELAKEVAATETIAASTAKAKKDPFAGRTGDFERHYLLEGANEIMPYRVYVPTRYDGTKSFPLIIALHGLGATEDSFFDGYNKRLPALAEEHGYIVAAPLGFRVDGFYGYGVIGSSEPAARQRTEMSEKDVMEVLRLMRASYKIDPSRIYLIGHSMGAIGTWAIAAKYPDIWAAIAPFSGLGSPASVERMRHVPEFVVHGDADPTVNVSGSRTMVAEMKKLGVEVNYIEVPGGNHINVVAPNLPAMFDFFNAHVKKPVTSSR
jgi:poly(3-hydroxybutyrate) depolymerase